MLFLGMLLGELMPGGLFEFYFLIGQVVLGVKQFERHMFNVDLLHSITQYDCERLWKTAIFITDT